MSTLPIVPEREYAAFRVWLADAIFLIGNTYGKKMALSPVTDAASFGAACRQRRKALGLTLQDAAGAAGVNYRFASELERGKPSCSLGLALRYARMLGVELFYDLAPEQVEL